MQRKSRVSRVSRRARWRGCMVGAHSSLCAVTLPPLLAVMAVGGFKHGGGLVSPVPPPSLHQPHHFKGLFETRVNWGSHICCQRCKGESARQQGGVSRQRHHRTALSASVLRSHRSPSPSTKAAPAPHHGHAATDSSTSRKPLALPLPTSQNTACSMSPCVRALLLPVLCPAPTKD